MEWVRSVQTARFEARTGQVESSCVSLRNVRRWLVSRHAFPILLLENCLEQGVICLLIFSFIPSSVIWYLASIVNVCLSSSLILTSFPARNKDSSSFPSHIFFSFLPPVVYVSSFTQGVIECHYWPSSRY